MHNLNITNPIVDGYYADPEARKYEGKYWIYATYSRPFSEQRNLVAFSSDDLCDWEKHDNIISMKDFPWVWGAVWAPTIIQMGKRYYLIFATNDIHSEEETGGLEIAVADHPGGPFHGFLHRPLIRQIVNGAQPIDAHLFKDDDGAVYLYYGGWGHCNVAVMKDTMDGFIPLEDGSFFKEVTPPDYMEGPCMLKRGDLYYFMWSTGSWVDDTYGVLYGTSKHPFGPFHKEGEILRSQNPIAAGPGHNSYYYLKDEDRYLIVYHRRDLYETNPNNRKLCIDVMPMEKGKIGTVAMTGPTVLANPVSCKA